MSNPTNNIISHRILIVEDDKGWQAIFRQKLLSKGFTVGLASTIDEARKELDSRVYQAVIVDLVLDESYPEKKEGKAVIRHIWELFDGTRAIIHSGYLDEDIINIIIRELAEEGIPVNSINFLKKGSKADHNETLLKVEEALSEAESENKRISARLLWRVSPFSFINGMLARDIQIAMGGGRMSELREFLGELCVPFAPWLQPVDPKALTRIDITDKHGDQKTVGFQTPFWSRTLGEAVLVRFGRRDLFDEALEKYSVKSMLTQGTIGEVILKRETTHYKGIIFPLGNFGFENFRKPAPKRTPIH